MGGHPIACGDSSPPEEGCPAGLPQLVDDIPQGGLWKSSGCGPERPGEVGLQAGIVCDSPPPAQRLHGPRSVFDELTPKGVTFPEGGGRPPAEGRNQAAHRPCGFQRKARLRWRDQHLCLNRALVPRWVLSLASVFVPEHGGSIIGELACRFTGDGGC